ncbi:glycosyltransferase family 2 protein [Algoriphagus aestuarii]|nr:glycosyltransferase family 2 protein [Algoriphagus aestuarii]
MKDLISIIIPTFNRVVALENAIRSVENQTYKNWELLVIDDFSTDSTASLVFEYTKTNPKIKYIKNTSKGANNARNHGLLNSSGEWVIFLDSDDELCVDMIEGHLSAAEAKSPVHMTVSYSKVYYEYNQSEVISDSICSEKLLLDFLTKKVTWPINAAMINRSYLVSKGLQFTPELLNGQDYCFFLSILFYQPTVGFIPKILSINHHKETEPVGVKVSAGNTLKYKLSRLRSRNIAFRIAARRLAPVDFVRFLRYYSKYQLGLIYLILKDGFR